jgi:MOSC domain-containing protein YiiM
VTDANEQPEDGAQVEAIWIKRFKRGPMDPAEEATLVAGRGMVGSSNQGGHRQITVIEQEKFEQLSRDLGVTVDPSVRRANLMIRGLPLTGVRDRVLRIGETRMRVIGETHGCERMDEAVPGLRAAMKQRHGGGAYGEVLDGGVIRVGDPVRWEESESQSG